MNISRKDLFLALAKDVPTEKDGELIPNPYKTWRDVNPKLPATKIKVLGRVMPFCRAWKGGGLQDLWLDQGYEEEGGEEEVQGYMSCDP